MLREGHADGAIGSFDRRRRPPARDGVVLGAEPLQIVERIFDSGDQEFINRQNAPPIHDLFLRERRALAVSWLRQTRQQLSILMSYHLKSARNDAGLKPAMELRIAAEYCMFVMVCRALIGLIWLRGPFNLHRGVGYAIRTASELCQISVEIFSKAQPPELARVSNL
jgi:hypothetical protein